MTGGALPFDGRTVLADTSAWHHAHADAVTGTWKQALLGGQVATCSLIRFELLFSTRDADDFRHAEQQLARLHDVPVTVSVQLAAQAAMRQLAERGPLHHRVPIPDLLVAAAAQESGLDVLHYDRHFDRLAEVLDFESRWLAPAGSL